MGLNLSEHDKYIVTIVRILVMKTSLLTMCATLCHHKKEKKENKNIRWQKISRKTVVHLKNKIIKIISVFHIFCFIIHRVV